jgi:hypothetical protein
LPCWQFTLVVPQGQRVAGVDVEALGERTLPGTYRVFPAQPPVPFSKTELPPMVPPDPAVYAVDAAYPGNHADAGPVGIKSGYRLVTIVLHPVQYEPLSGRLTVAGDLAVTVRYEPDPTARPARLAAAQARSFGDAVRALVKNPEDVSRYAPAVRATDFGEIDCVIITSGALQGGFQPLADWHTRKGFKTEIQTVSWITSNYSGRDNQEKIRNFISDYYTNHGLRWVVLGGDNGVVPCRQARAYCGGETGDIPCDLYYADLQGTWDDDNDNIFGEAGDDNVNLYSDVYVGRASVDNSTQVQTFVNKILTHEQNPPTDYLRRILLVDAALWSGYNHRQSNDSIAAITPSGWTDVVIHDPGSSTSVRDSVNNGFQLCHLVGHGNEYGVYDGWAYYNSDYAANQTNGSKVNFMNSIACYTGNFEYSDCCAEEAHNCATGGSIATVFNSRYGWGQPPSMGPSEILDIRLYDFFFNHDTMPIGLTHALSKEVYRNNALGDQCWRWCYYETNLFGDPLLLMYKDVPVQLDAAFTNPIGTGSQSFTVTVTASGSPVDKALVCVSKGSEVYDRNYTNGSGQVTFTINPASAGYMYVTSTKPNYLPDEDSSQVQGGVLHDAACLRIVAPAGTIDSGTATSPQAWVRNLGILTISFPVTLRIGSFYSNAQNVNNLAPGESTLVNFAGWTANQRGTHAVCCTTGLANDQNPANDEATGQVSVRVLDVGVTQMVAPSGNIDSGATVAPQVRVKNLGTGSASFPVTFRIGAFYANTQNVTNLNPGDSILVSFTNWTAVQCGTHATRCTTALSGDMAVNNNALSGTVNVRVLNVGVTQITAPTGTVDSGTVVTPRARVKNFGTGSASFPVTFRIGTFYANTQNVTSLNPGDSTLVSFANWAALQRGPHATRCSTALSGDIVHSNDTLSGQVAVRVLDVAATRILAPTGTIDSGTVVTPQARVKNPGTGPASFPVTFRIGTFYTNTQNVTNLNPGDSILVSFADWTVLQRGTHTTRCSTALTGDMAPGNDAVSCSVFVRTPGDVGVTAIVGPSGTLDSGAAVTPQAWVRNFGAAPASFPVTFRIGTFYANTQNVTNLNPGDSILVSFTNWAALQRGPHATRCTTALLGDTVPDNDAGAGSVTVRVLDAGVFSISAPAGSYEPRRIVVPAATWHNYGTDPANFDAWLFITDPSGRRIHSDCIPVSDLAPGADVFINTFPACTLMTPGNWTARCSTVMAGDAGPSDDVLNRGFDVHSSWTETRSLPQSPSGKPPKDGAWLTYMANDGLVYAGKGNKTGDFYSFAPASGVWAQHNPIPPGPEGRLPSKGTVGCADGGGSVYLVKGNNTLAFWRYATAADSWLKLADVPAGKKVKGGADAAYVDYAGNGYVYLLKGSRCEFCRYDVAADQWQSMEPAPSGMNPKWNPGSFIVFDGDHTIYAHKAKYNELWAYDVSSDSWGTAGLNGMPLIGRSGRLKKSKEGATGTWVDGSLFALKGGNTNEFWQYVAAADRWNELDTIPNFGSSGRAKRIKAGADIVSAEGVLYVLKGNRTCEFWRYVPGVLQVPEARRDGISSSAASPPDGLLRIAPNPLVSGAANVYYCLPGRGRAGLTVCDATGRVVLSRALPLRTGRLTLELPAGVYLVKLATGESTTVRKLVISR